MAEALSNMQLIRLLEGLDAGRYKVPEILRYMDNPHLLSPVVSGTKELWSMAEVNGRSVHSDTLVFGACEDGDKIRTTDGRVYGNSDRPFFSPRVFVRSQDNWVSYLVANDPRPLFINSQEVARGVTVSHGFLDNGTPIFERDGILVIGEKSVSKPRHSIWWVEIVGSRVFSHCGWQLYLDGEFVGGLGSDFKFNFTDWFRNSVAVHGRGTVLFRLVNSGIFLNHQLWLDIPIAKTIGQVCLGFFRDGKPFAQISGQRIFYSGLPVGAEVSFPEECVHKTTHQMVGHHENHYAVTGRDHDDGPANKLTIQLPSGLVKQHHFDVISEVIAVGNDKFAAIVCHQKKYRVVIIGADGEIEKKWHQYDHLERLRASPSGNHIVAVAQGKRAKNKALIAFLVVDDCAGKAHRSIRDVGCFRDHAIRYVSVDFNPLGPNHSLTVRGFEVAFNESD